MSFRFPLLIEKEWLQLGHPFAERAALHGKDKDKLVPGRTFTLFLDCVWQIQRQYPGAFEFNDKYLMYLSDQALSSEHGKTLQLS